jgi:hypothetical protein
LIERLVLELKPVKRLRSPLRRTIQFACVAMAATVVAVSLGSFRADLALKLRNPAYLAESGALFVLFGAATLAALRSAVPGVRLGWASWLAGAAGGAWLLIVGAHYLATPDALELASGLACFRRTLALSALPAGVLLAMMRRAAPVDAGISGSLTMVASGALAVLGTRVLCAKDDATHVLAWHLAPVAAFALLGWFVGRIWLIGRARSSRSGDVESFLR